MGIRKIYCNVVEGVTYEDRCLFKLSKVIEGNPVCEDCTLRELLRLKRCGVKVAEARPVEKPRPRKKPKAVKRKHRKDVKGIKDINVSTTAEVINGSSVPRSIVEAPALNDEAKPTYSVQDLVKPLRKSKRRVQEWAKEGKIPGAHKSGPHWAFDKEEIDQWLLKKTGDVKTAPESEEEQDSTTSQKESELSAGVPGDSTFREADGSGMTSHDRVPGEPLCPSSEKGENEADKKN
ncbi:MAG: helix-turn-helix domain-containing protein [Thermodesulfobacteriota bacterium]